LQYGAHAESRKGLDETSSSNKTRDWICHL
jgi:hypothetical protein